MNFLKKLFKNINRNKSKEPTTISEKLPSQEAPVEESQEEPTLEFESEMEPDVGVKPDIYTQDIPEKDISVYLKRKLPCGYLPGQLVFLKWINGRKGYIEVPRYFALSYGIDGTKTTQQFLQNDILKFGDTEVCLKNLKVAELKGLLKKYDLPISGRKGELIQRVKSYVTPEDLEEVPASLEMTEKGEELLDENEDLFHAVNDGIRITGFLATTEKYPSIHEYKTLRRLYYEDTVQRCEREESYYELTIAFGNIAQIQYEEQKYKEALFSILKKIIIGLSGLGNYTQSLGKPFYDSIFVQKDDFRLLEKILVSTPEEQFDSSFKEAVKYYQSLPVKGFLTKKDIRTLKEHIKNKDIVFIREYVKKYGDQTFLNCMNSDERLQLHQ